MICLCAKTRRVARLLTRRYEEALRPAALTPEQFELISEIAHRPGVPQASLAHIVALDQTTLSRSINLLLKRGLLVQARSPRDRRQMLYSLTPKGQEIWQRALPLWQAAQDSLESSVGDQWPVTLAALDHLGRSLAL